MSVLRIRGDDAPARVGLCRNLLRVRETISAGDTSAAGTLPMFPSGGRAVVGPLLASSNSQRFPVVSSHSELTVTGSVVLSTAHRLFQRALIRLRLIYNAGTTLLLDAIEPEGCLPVLSCA